MVAASLVSADATPLASTVAGNIKLRIKNNLLMVFIGVLLRSGAGRSPE
jgi:hypothetical protein